MYLRDVELLYSVSRSQTAVLFPHNYSTVISRDVLGKVGSLTWLKCWFFVAFFLAVELTVH